jgi:hypothetical protein
MIESVPPVGQLHPLMHRTGVGQQFLQQAMHPPGVPSPFGGSLAFDPVEFLQHLDRNREIVVLEIEDRLRVVQEDVGVEDEGLDLGRNPDPRVGGACPARVFHQLVDIL